MYKVFVFQRLLYYVLQRIVVIYKFTAVFGSCATSTFSAQAPRSSGMCRWLLTLYSDSLLAEVFLHHEGANFENRSI
jgi:hypothetical protein